MQKKALIKDKCSKLYYSAHWVIGALSLAWPNFEMIFLDKLQQNIKLLNSFSLFNRSIIT